MPTVSLPELNDFCQSDFVNTLSDIFEHSPWVAELAYSQRPYDSIDSLLTEMKNIVMQSSHQKQLTLICNHPELAGREAQKNALTDHSKQEQASAGLDHCSPAELHKLRALNKQYNEKFGFPFIIAVRNLSRYDIFEAIQKRLQNTQPCEFDNAIQQINRIAEFRIHQTVTQ